MSEYYSRWEIERKFSDYEERLEKQQARIDYLEQRREEEEEEKKEKYSDYEKKEGGNCLRVKLTKKYNYDFQKALKYVSYSNKHEFNDFYFNMFTFDEIEAGYIPKEAFENASEQQIRNILCDAIPYFGDSIVNFGWGIEKLSKKQLKCLTNDQCLLIVNLLSIYTILPKDKKEYVIKHIDDKMPKQECNTSCLLI